MGIRSGFNGSLRAMRLVVLSAVLALIAMASPEVRAMAKGVPGGPGVPDGPHQGVSQEVLAEIVRLYEGGASDVNALMGRAVEKLGVNKESRSGQFARARAASLSAQIDAKLKAIGVKGRSLVTASTKDSYEKGITQAASQLRKLGLDQAAGAAGADFGTTIIDERAVGLIARDTVASLDTGLKLHAARAERVFRSLSAGPLADQEPEVNRAIARGIISGDPRIAQRAVRDLFRESEAESYRQVGNKIIQVGGWSGSVRTYTAMVTVTRTREATVAARHGRISEQGFGLVQITGRESKNFCTRYLGMVFALTEQFSEGGKYPTLASLPRKGPPFHPFCTKGTTLYVPELASDNQTRAYDDAREAFERARATGVLGEPLAA